MLTNRDALSNLHPFLLISKFARLCVKQMTIDNILHAAQMCFFWKLLAALQRWVDDILHRKCIRSSAFVSEVYGLLYSGLTPYPAHLSIDSLFSSTFKMHFRQISLTKFSQTFLTNKLPWPDVCGKIIFGHQSIKSRNQTILSAPSNRSNIM